MEFETRMLVAKSSGEKEEERGGLEKCWSASTKLDMNQKFCSASAPCSDWPDNDVYSRKLQGKNLIVSPQRNDKNLRG